MTSVVYEGIGFNQEWIQSFKTEKEFTDAMNKKEADGSGYTHYFEGDVKRADKLKELYKVATAKPEAKVEGTPAVNQQGTH